MMSEYPFDKPRQNLAWADDGTKTEPSPILKSSGFSAAGERQAAHFNWRYSELKKWIEWLKEDIYKPRRFTSPSEAIDGSSPGDLIRIEREQKWDDGNITRVSSNVDLICSDGRYVFFATGDLELKAVDGDAYAERNSPYWSADLSALGLERVYSISTDGASVCVRGNTGTGVVYFLFPIANKGMTHSSPVDCHFILANNSDVSIIYSEFSHEQLIAMTGTLGNLNPALGVRKYELLNPAVETSVVWGDGYGFTEGGVYSFLPIKNDILHWSLAFGETSSSELALSSHFLWCIISGALVARPIERSGFEIWERLAPGKTSGNTQRLLKIKGSK